MRRLAALPLPGACLAVGFLVLTACSSFTARRHVAFTLETVPPSGAVRIDGRVYRGTGARG